MHIVFVCAEYPLNNQPTGGFGSYVQNIVPVLIKLGHKVEIISHNNTLNINSYISFLPFKRIFKFFNYPLLFSFATGIKLHQIHYRSPIDIVEGGDFAGELFGYLLFKNSKYPKVIVKLHTPSFVIRKYNSEKINVFYAIMEKLEVFCLKYVDQIYSPTKSLADIIENKIKRKISTVIPYPITPTKKIHNTKRKKNLILYVGKLQTKKGVFTLLNAVPGIIKKNVKVKFLFVGPDTREDNASVKDQMEKLIKNKKIQSFVKIQDPISKNKLNALYQEATITIIPSVWENFPNVLLEAGINKSPVIATNVGGILEMITHKKNGLLIKPNDSKKLSKTINFLLSQPEMQKKLSQSLYKDVIETYNPGYIAQKTIKFYERVLRENKVESAAP